MPKPALDIAPVTPEWLDEVIASGEAGPAEPLFRAARFASVALFSALPGEVFGHAVDVIRGRPWVAILGDEEGGQGPAGFDGASLLAVCGEATHTVVSSAYPSEELYAVLALASSLGGRVLAIGTRVERHAEWYAFLRKHAHQAAYLDVSMPEGTA